MQRRSVQCVCLPRVYVWNNEPERAKDADLSIYLVFFLFDKWLKVFVYTQCKRKVQAFNKSKNTIINLAYSTCYNWFTELLLLFSNSLDLNKEKRKKTCT